MSRSIQVAKSFLGKLHHDVGFEGGERASQTGWKRQFLAQGTAGGEEHSLLREQEILGH